MLVYVKGEDLGSAVGNICIGWNVPVQIPFNSRI
jgi:hypothetical protein